jgi:excisionase family DNA binding protein
MNGHKPWLTTREVADHFGLSEWTIRRRCRTGDIPAINTSRGTGKGNRYRISAATVRLIEQQVVEI